MKYSTLGTTDIKISRICMGTMTWGKQNDQEQADAQMNMALDMGVNFWDTAEMYPMFAKPSEYGITESILGNWMARNASRRSEIVLATKFSPVGDHPNGRPRAVTRDNLRAALDASLEKLNTDYVDLYQLHWPDNRKHYHFFNHWDWQHASGVEARDACLENMSETVLALGELIDEGKIRTWGLSDDTAWGMNQFLRLCDHHGVPRPVSTQQEYHVMMWRDELVIHETCALEGVSYLPWGPIAGGLLSGKYNDGKRPEGARYSKGFELPDEKRPHRLRQSTLDAVADYQDMGKRLGIDVCQLAIAWTIRQPWMTSTIIGATNLDQLRTNIEAVNFEITDEMTAELAKLRFKYPAPF